MTRELAARPQRRSPRHEADLACHVFVEAGERHLRGTALDVSSVGVRILSEAPVERGESVVLTLRLPDGRTWVDAHARVARVEEGLREGDSGRAIAFEFTSMEPEHRRDLVAATNAAPKTGPRRGVFRLSQRSWG